MEKYESHTTGVQMYANFFGKDFTWVCRFVPKSYVCIRLFRKYMYVSWNAYKSHRTIHKLRARILCAIHKQHMRIAREPYTHVSEVDRLPFVSWNAYESHTTKVYMYANFCEKACAYVSDFCKKALTGSYAKCMHVCMDCIHIP